jgi:hypothetical protein
MSIFICERCDIDYGTKKGLLQHLKKKTPCLSINKDIEPEKLIKLLNKKDGLTCDKCNRVYKNNNSLRTHRCKSTDKIEQLENKIDKLTNIILEMAKNPQVITNHIDNSTKNITNNTMNITLNCLMDTTGKPIEYLLNQEDITDKILGWMKLNQKLISTYMKEKYYNIEHPENHMIRAGKDGDSIELYISGKWKKYENVKGADMILTNIGNDFGLFLEILKSNPDLYTGKKKILTQFEKDIIKPLNWGFDVSDDSGSEKSFQLIKNENGGFTTVEEQEDRIINLKLQDIAIQEVHTKIF